MSFNQAIHLVRDNYVFRGLKDAQYRLEPSVARKAPLAQHHALRREEGIVRNFRKYAVATPVDFRTEATYWDWLALAQHHGAPTRLLDWTWSPLVALYFTIWRETDEELASRDAAIWCIDPLLAVSTNADPIFRDLLGDYLMRGYGPYNLHAPKLTAMEYDYDVLCRASSRVKQEPSALYPWFVHDVLQGKSASGGALAEQLLLFMELPSCNPRIVAQSGLFSLMSGPPNDIIPTILARQPKARHPNWHRLPSELIMSDSTLQVTLGSPLLATHYDLLGEILYDQTSRPLAVKLTIPKDIRIHLNNWLLKMRVDDRTMFPDLDGLGNHTRAMYSDPVVERGHAWP